MAADQKTGIQPLAGEVIDPDRPTFFAFTAATGSGTGGATQVEARLQVALVNGPFPLDADDADLLWDSKLRENDDWLQGDVNPFDPIASSLVSADARRHIRRHALDIHPGPPQTERQARGQTVADRGAEHGGGIRATIAAERLRFVEEHGSGTDDVWKFRHELVAARERERHMVVAIVRHHSLFTADSDVAFRRGSSSSIAAVRFNPLHRVST